MMVANEQTTLVITCKASPAQKLAVAEIISNKVRIVSLDEVQEPADDEPNHGGGYSIQVSETSMMPL